MKASIYFTLKFKNLNENAFNGLQSQENIGATITKIGMDQGVTSVFYHSEIDVQDMQKMGNKIAEIADDLVSGSYGRVGDLVGYEIDGAPVFEARFIPSEPPKPDKTAQICDMWIELTKKFAEQKGIKIGEDVPDSEKA